MFRLKRCDLLFVGCLGLLLIWCVTGPAFPPGEAPPADDVPIVYRGARIYTVAGPVIERGVLVILKGKIAAVGPEGTVAVPPGASWTRIRTSASLAGRAWALRPMAMR
jgi:hypothetical protein